MWEFSTKCLSKLTLITRYIVRAKIIKNVFFFFFFFFFSNVHQFIMVSGTMIKMIDMNTQSRHLLHKYKLNYPEKDHNHKA